MDNGRKLVIVDSVLDDILAAARTADRHECMGMLASNRHSGSHVISAACLLPVEASGSHAEADPSAVWRAAELLAKRKKRPMGIWHSHGAHGVYHSATDDETVTRLFPAMAEWSFQRPRPAFAAPMVTAPDEASLPLPDGRCLRVQVVGPQIPVVTASERISWSSIEISFTTQNARREAILDEASVQLVSNGVRLTLGVPEGAGVQSQVEDLATIRSARLFSLVVNRRGEKYGEAVAIHDFDGESMIDKRECEIIVSQDPTQHGHTWPQLLGLRA